MTHIVQSALTMLHAGEWMPVTAARVLIGIFFCISGGTKLFVPSQFAVLEQTMVQIRVPFPHATALFVATVEFACGAGLGLGLLTPLCAAMLVGDMIVAIATTSIHTIQARSVLALARRLSVPPRGAIRVDPRLADLLWAGSDTASMASSR